MKMTDNTKLIDEEYHIGGVNFKVTEEGLKMKDSPDHCDYVLTSSNPSTTILGKWDSNKET